MHPYAITRFERKYVTAGLGASSVLLSLGVSALASSTQWDPPTWLPVPTAPVLFGIGYLAMDKWMWRWKLLRALRISRNPDLAGTWNGTAKSSYTEFKVSQDVEIEIHQSWTEMIITSKTETSQSTSSAASIDTSTPGQIRLYYHYHNRPQADAPIEMVQHDGSSVLVFTPPNSLSGGYFNGRGRMTYGELALTRNP